jgi:hypothetical protein
MPKTSPFSPLTLFDTLIPFQYSEQDRRAGYFFGRRRPERNGYLFAAAFTVLYAIIDSASVGFAADLVVDFAKGFVAGPATGEMLMRVGDWAFFRPSAHPSWCPIGDVKVETRAYVLLGSCR